MLAVLYKLFIYVADSTTCSGTNCQPPIVQSDLLRNRGDEFQKIAIDDNGTTRDKVLS